MIVTDINILKLKSTPVETVKEAKDIISKLEEEIKSHSTAVGLSAIQIGIAKQVAIIKDKDKFHPIINPYLADDLEDEFIYGGEGCLSFPGLHVNTKRYVGIVIGNNEIEDGTFRPHREYYYYNEEGPKDITSIIVQHEIDHMNGIVIEDRKAEEPLKQLKIGRNDPCPCGSGKKYKKCCLK
jgi:peptide deformylase